MKPDISNRPNPMTYPAEFEAWVIEKAENDTIRWMPKRPPVSESTPKYKDES